MTSIPSYQMTDLGMIPPDWQIKSVRELNFDISDGNYSSKYPKASDFVSAGVPFIRANNIKQMTVVDDDMRFISKNLHDELQKGHLKRNDILITTRGEIGQIAFVPDRYIDANINAQIVRCNSERTGVVPKYLGYVFSSITSQRQFNDLQTGSALKQLPVGKFKDLKIVLATQSEQELIANALSDVDALIESLEKLIAKKKLIKRGVTDLLVGRLANLNPNNGLVTKPLEDLCSFQNGKALEQYFNPHNGKNVISIGNYSEDGKYVNSESYIETEKHLESQKYVLKRNDLALLLNDKTSAGTIIGRAILIEEDSKYVFNQRTMRLTSKGEVSTRFLWLVLNSDYYHAQIVSLAKPGTQIYLNTGDILSFKVSFPQEKDRQMEIENTLFDMDAELDSLKTKLSKTYLLKQGMMQELLTGRIRLV